MMKQIEDWLQFEDDKPIRKVTTAFTSVLRGLKKEVKEESAASWKTHNTGLRKTIETRRKKAERVKLEEESEADLTSETVDDGIRSDPQNDGDETSNNDNGDNDKGKWQVACIIIRTYGRLRKNNCLNSLLSCLKLS